jgi:hypothetical protein
MKALLTAFALLSFVGASTLPIMASAQETKGDQTMSKPEGAATTMPKSSHKATHHKKTTKKKSHHKSSAKKGKAPETPAAPKEG